MRFRSLLFVPADSRRKIEKAQTLASDALILDLEDAVAEPAKEAARQGAVAALAQLDRSRVIVRINGRDTGHYLADLVAVVPARPAAVLLPKCTGLADVVTLDHHLEVLEVAHGLQPGSVRVLALATENAASLEGLSYRGSPPRLAALCFGAEDLAADLGLQPRAADGSFATPIARARDALLIAAAAAGLPAIDTPFPDPRDAAGLARETEAAVRDGFSGKLCIHPSQVPVATAAFTPSSERVTWAKRVAELFADTPDAGVLTLDGKMIDRPHLLMARRVLASVD